MSRKHNKVHKTLNYIEHLLILISTITGCVSNSSFSYLVGIPIKITISAIEWKICVLTGAIKKYESLIKKKRKNMIK